MGAINKELMIETTDLDKTQERKWGVSPEDSLGGNLRAKEKKSQQRQKGQPKRLEEKHERASWYLREKSVSRRHGQHCQFLMQTQEDKN